jgi:site-specific DNA-methyltransferase (adenine-specific)
VGEAKLLIGDVFDRIEDIEPGSIDMMMTSPPFWKLRNYIPSDHPDKAKEIGQEPTPGEYLATMLRLVDRTATKLARHGSVCVEIGDTFAGSGGAGGDYAEGGLRDGQPAFNGSGRTAAGSKHGVDPMRPGNTSSGTPSGGTHLPDPKSLCLIPTLFAASLAYGRNLLTGEPLESGKWLVRNLVVWARPNPPVGDLGDKFRPGTSFMTIATRAKDRYFDLDAVRVPHKSPDDGSSMQNRKSQNAAPEVLGAGGSGMFNPNGTPPLDWWEPWPIEVALWDWWQDEVWKIVAGGYPGAHYAVYPPSLCVRPIKSMCPEKVCRTCGEPSRRIVESTRYARDGSVLDSDFTQGSRERGLRQTNESDGGPQFSHVERVDVGWTDCGHDDWRAGCVFDPFGGSGTTAAVATGHGRDAVLIDLNEANAGLCRERIGMFLTDIVEKLRDVPPRPIEDIPMTMEAML